MDVDREREYVEIRGIFLVPRGPVYPFFSAIFFHSSLFFLVVPLAHIDQDNTVLAVYLRDWHERHVVIHSTGYIVVG